MHPHAEVLSAMPQAFRQLATKQLQQHVGLILKLNQRVASYDAQNHELILQSGDKLPCDVFLPAHPEGGNTNFFTR